MQLVILWKEDYLREKRGKKLGQNTTSCDLPQQLEEWTTGDDWRQLQNESSFEKS